MKEQFNVINYHFLNACNYVCKHCFVDKTKRELTHSQKLQVIDELNKYFKQNNILNPRINLVGGEPFLYPKLGELIEYIASYGIKVSIVTNGSLITDEFLDRYGKYISMIGLSIDGLSRSKNILIGRCTSRKETISTDKLIYICESIHNHGIKLKINICLSKLNYQEDYYSFLSKVHADRIKILCLSICKGINDSMTPFVPRKEEYQEFVNKIKIFNPVLERPGSMHRAYVIINCEGSLILNNEEKEVPLTNVLLTGLNTSHLSKLNYEKYLDRYKSPI